MPAWDCVHIPEPGRKMAAPDDSSLGDMPSHKPREPKVGEEEKHRGWVLVQEWWVMGW